MGKMRSSKYDSKLTNVSVEYSSEFCGSIRGWLTPQGNLNLDIHLNRTLRQRTLLQRVEGGSKATRYQTLFSYDVDACRTLKQLFQASPMKVWLRNVFKCQPAFCDLRNFQLENHSIPGYLRAGFDTNYYRRPRGGQRRLVATFTLDIKFY